MSDTEPLLCLTMDPRDPRTLYIGTQHCGILKSADGGASWTTLQIGGKLDRPIASLTIDPQDSRTIYAGTDHRVFKSTDGGATWSYVTPDSEASGLDLLAVDPFDSRILYATDRNRGLLKSTAGGVGEESSRASLTVLPDLDGNGAKELAVLRESGVRPGYRSSVLFKDTETGGTVGEIGCLDPQFRPMRLVRIDDSDGKGTPALAVLAVQEDAAGTLLQVKVELRDPRTGLLLNEVSFDAAYRPDALFWLNDLNQNGICELALLGTNPTTGRSTVQIKDSATGAILKTLTAAPNGTVSSIALWALADLNGNGSQELAILQRETATGLCRIKVLDSKTGWTVRLLPCLDPRWIPVGMAWFRDMNGNKAPELGVLARDAEEDHVIVQILDSRTGKVLNTVPFNSRFVPEGIAAADILGDRGFELAVFGTDPGTGSAQVELRNPLTGDPIKNIPVP